MGARAPLKPRAVFDTNLVLSALGFEGRLASWLRTAWINRFTPLASTATIAELQEVLRYRKFKLAEADVQELLGDYLPHIEIADVHGVCPLKCCDARDQKFLDLAHAAKADLLVSGDSDLLALAGQTRFRILAPAELSAD